MDTSRSIQHEISSLKGTACISLARTLSLSYSHTYTSLCYALSHRTEFIPNVSRNLDSISPSLYVQSVILKANAAFVQEHSWINLCAVQAIGGGKPVCEGHAAAEVSIRLKSAFHITLLFSFFHCKDAA